MTDLAAGARHDRPLRLVVLLSGTGRTLVNLADAIAEGRLEARIVLVLSSRRDAPGLERARERGLPARVLRPADHESREAWWRAQTDAILAARPDLVIMAGYLLHYRVPEALAGRILNIHPSLLPRHGGQGMYGDRVHAAVLAAGETESGCTVHVVDDVYDHGPVVARETVPVRPDDDTASLAARVFEAECRLYPAAIARYAARLVEDGREAPREDTRSGSTAEQRDATDE